MGAIRADFVCLALNFTLCSVFTGRYFAGDTAPPPLSADPSGFVLLDSRQHCPDALKISAAGALSPTLETLSWSRALCPNELESLQTVPPTPMAPISSPLLSPQALASSSMAGVCASAFARKGSKLFALHEPPQDAPEPSLPRSGASGCTGGSSRSSRSAGSRLGALEVCSLLRDYSKGKAPNALGHDATFILRPDASNVRRTDAPPRPDMRASGSRSKAEGGEEEEAEEEKGRSESGNIKARKAKKGSSSYDDEEDVLLDALTEMSMEGVVSRDDVTKLRQSHPNVLMQLALQQINNKKYRAALALYSMVESEETLHERMVGQGTCYLLLSEPEMALKVFTKGVAAFPQSAEMWRRKASADDALGHKEDAQEDLTRALEIEPEHEEAHQQRGALAFNLHDYWTAIEDFKWALGKRPNEPILFNAWGLALMGAGQYQDAVDVFVQAVQANPWVANLWSEKGRAHKELAQAEAAEESLQRALDLEYSTVTFHRLANLKMTMGHHREALEVARKGLVDNPGDLELQYTAGSCLQALGDFIGAIQTYEHMLSLPSPQNGGHAGTCQLMAFYQREFSVYIIQRGHLPLTSYNIDKDFDVKFRVKWVKKQNPLELFPNYTMQSVDRENLMRAPLDYHSLSEPIQKLIEAADRIGSRSQYHVPGFMANKRQHRMAGLAALDIMQQVRASWQAMNQTRMGRASYSSGRVSATRPTSTKGFIGDKDADDAEGYEAGNRGSSRWGRKSGASELIKGWRDMANRIVRWRQISEPTDTVAWVDQLEDDYQEGFGSITAMTVGQMQNLKYYPVYDRGFKLMKQRLYSSEEAMNGTGTPMHIPRAKHGDAILAAETRRDLWHIVGENFYVNTECYSMAHPGEIINGTQLTLVESSKSYDFAIRTAVVPERMRDFGEEMQAAWEDLTAAVLDNGKMVREPALRMQLIKNNILRIAYYWYQLMPLTRGSAMVGFVGILGLSLANDIEITEFIPKGMQVDWESILAPRFEEFNEAVGSWMFQNTAPAPLHLPNVMETLPTLRHIHAALSYERP